MSEFGFPSLISIIRKGERGTRWCHLLEPPKHEDSGGMGLLHSHFCQALKRKYGDGWLGIIFGKAPECQSLFSRALTAIPFRHPGLYFVSISFSFLSRSLLAADITNTDYSSFTHWRCHMLTHSNTWNKKSREVKNSLLWLTVWLTMLCPAGLFRMGNSLPNAHAFQSHMELAFSHCLLLSHYSEGINCSAFPQIF